VLAILLTGCAQHGPDLVKAGRNDYNKVLVQTDEEETLLNLVRLRYADNPMMLDVSSVSTSFTWTQSASAEAFKFEPSSSDSNVGVRGNLA
jgi:DNA-binding GntR family transcriptional regulator